MIGLPFLAVVVGIVVYAVALLVGTLRADAQYRRDVAESPVWDQIGDGPGTSRPDRPSGLS